MNKMVQALLFALLSASAQAGMEAGEKSLNAGDPVTAFLELAPLAGQGDKKAARLVVSSYVWMTTFYPSRLGWRYRYEPYLELMKNEGNPAAEGEYGDLSQAVTPTLPNPAENLARMKTEAASGNPDGLDGLANFYIGRCGRRCKEVPEIEGLLNTLYGEPAPADDAGLVALATRDPKAIPRKWRYFSIAETYIYQVASNVSEEFARLHALREQDKSRLHRVYLDQVKIQAARSLPSVELMALRAFHGWEGLYFCTDPTRANNDHIVSGCEDLKTQAREWLEIAAAAGSKRSQAALLVLRVQKDAVFAKNSDAELAELVQQLGAIPAYTGYWRAVVDEHVQLRRKTGAPKDVTLWLASANSGDLNSVERLVLHYAQQNQPDEAYRWCRLMERFSDRAESVRDPKPDNCEYYISRIAKSSPTVSDAAKLAAEEFATNWRPKTAAQ